MIGHAIQAHTAGNAQPLQPGLFLATAAAIAEQHFFGNLLDAGRDVGIMLVQFAKLIEVRRRIAKICGEA